MHVIKATFDGTSIVLPGEARGLPPGEVIVVFEDGAGPDAERETWTRAQEAAFREAWNNDEDAIYDTL